MAKSDRCRLPASRFFSATLSALLASLVLSACAPVAPKLENAAKPAAQAEKTAAADDAAAKNDVGPLPDVALTGDLLFQALMAEISGQRGQLNVAVNQYIDLAKKTRDPRIARRAAEVAVYARQNVAALEPAQLWVELAPNSLAARQLMVGVLASMDRLDEAEVHLKYVLERDANHAADILMRLTRTLARSGDRKDLAQMIMRVSANMKGLPEVGFARAYACHALGEAERGLPEIEQALSLKPDWEQAALLKAQLLQEKNGQQAALDYLQTYLKARPDAAEVRQQYARALAGEKKFDEARTQFKTLEHDQPGNSEIGHALAVLALQSGDLDEAQRRFEGLLQSGQGSANALRLALGQLSEMRNQPEAALVWYDQITPGEQYTQAKLRHANLMLPRTGVDAARAYLKEAAKRLPLDAAAERAQLILGEANLLRDANRNEECQQVLEEGLKAYPDNVDLLYDAGLGAEKLGRHEEAEVRLRELIRLRPDHAHAYNALGYSLTERGERLDEAELLLSKAVELAPGDPFIMDSLGWLLFKRGNFKAAAEQLAKAYLLKADPEIAAHLGEAQWQMGQKEQAVRTWREAAKANSDNDVLGATMKKYLEPAAK